MRIISIVCTPCKDKMPAGLDWSTVSTSFGPALHVVVLDIPLAAEVVRAGATFKKDVNYQWSVKSERADGIFCPDFLRAWSQTGRGIGIFSRKLDIRYLELDALLSASDRERRDRMAALEALPEGGAVERLSPL